MSYLLAERQAGKKLKPCSWGLIDLEGHVALGIEAFKGEQWQCFSPARKKNT